MSRRVLITGGTGFVGSHAVEAYLAAGWQVRAWVRNPNRLTWLKSLQIEIASGKFEDFDAICASMHECNVVVHCAGLTKTPHRKEYFEVNAVGVRSFAQAARNAGVKRFVLCSTHAASGPAQNGTMSHEDDPPRPMSEYGRSKLAGEQELKDNAGGMEWVILRPPSILGPRDEQFLPLFRSVKRYGIYPCLGRGNQAYSYIYVKDFSRALLAAGESERGQNEVYFVANQEPLDWRRAATKIGTFAGRQVHALTIPAFAARVVGMANDITARITGRAALLSSEKIREMLATGWVCSAEKIRGVWGFTCEYSTERALRETYDFYSQNKQF